MADTEPTLEGVTDALGKMHEGAKNKAKDAMKLFEDGRKAVGNATKESLDKFQKELEFWKKVAADDTLKNEFKTEFGRQVLLTTESIYERFKAMTVPFKNPGQTAQTLFEKFGEFANKAVDFMRPIILQIVNNPLAGLILSPERIKMFEAFVSGDRETAELFENIRLRLPADTKFAADFSDKRSLTEFNDAHMKMKTVRGANYSKTQLIVDIKDKLAAKKLATIGIAEVAEVAMAYANDAVKNEKPVPPEAPKAPGVLTISKEGAKIKIERNGITKTIERTGDGKLSIDGEKWGIATKGTDSFGEVMQIENQGDTLKIKVSMFGQEKEETLPKDKVIELFDNVQNGKPIPFEIEVAKMKMALEFKKV